jgi:arsenate reductase
MARERVLFVSTHNAARSQMAEAMLRNWGSDHFETCSAGTHATALRPEAVAVMAEVGIDISGHEAKSIDLFAGESLEWLITVCDTARVECPIFPGVQQAAHWGIDDPEKVEGDEATRLTAYRSARDELGSRIRLFLRAAMREELGHPSAETLPEATAH